MVFKCQEDSFLKKFETKVVSCESATLDLKTEGKKPSKEKPCKEKQSNEKPASLAGYNVIFEDTILFPEGGGQPCDYGTVNGKPVRSVVRKGSTAVHFVESEAGFELGDVVQQSIDWPRRLDHMQQHSGQHLITALFDREFKYETVSWWLGESVSYIKLATPHLISRQSLDHIEQQANDLIREGRMVSVQLMDPETAVELQDARAPRGLPKDHEGLARIVSIEDIESNMCCGTHVANLTQLQIIKLLYAEKDKSNVLVHFVVGQRVLNKLGEMFEREQKLTEALKCGALQHLEMVKKLQENVKSGRDSHQELLKEYATAEAEHLNNLSPAAKPKYFQVHRRDVIDPLFTQTFFRYAPEDILYFLTVCEPGAEGKGEVVLRGDAALVQQFGPKFLELLEGKGYTKEGYMQGKFTNVAKLAECSALLEAHFKPPKKVIAPELPENAS